VLRWPGGGFIWRRPASLHVVSEGHTYTLPIVNTTLYAACAAVAVGVAFAVLIRALARLGRSA
jgi:hypothetical protein